MPIIRCRHFHAVTPLRYADVVAAAYYAPYAMIISLSQDAATLRCLR